MASRNVTRSCNARTLILVFPPNGEAGRIVALGEVSKVGKNVAGGQGQHPLMSFIMEVVANTIGGVLAAAAYALIVKTIRKKHSDKR